MKIDQDGLSEKSVRCDQTDAEIYTGTNSYNTATNSIITVVDMAVYV